MAIADREVLELEVNDYLSSVAMKTLMTLVERQDLIFNSCLLKKISSSSPEYGLIAEESLRMVANLAMCVMMEKYGSHKLYWAYSNQAHFELSPLQEMMILHNLEVCVNTATFETAYSVDQSGQDAFTWLYLDIVTDATYKKPNLKLIA
ncbi:hypothetical protein [uncultured Methylophaga sp.]|uniref:hypothetical protein n=1 Tax=uncultured Methylophaga sp. TaxID=285271 RepID=UPI002637026C|nr:hypothetical protein [uncultured Methylophaga sp.]